MENDPSIEKAAERIVAWAAHHPLSVAETERRYAHLLAGLPPIPVRSAQWAVVKLGRLAVRYWQERVEEVRQTLDELSFAPALAYRGGGPAEAPAAAPERILRALGDTGVACLKITENPDHATVALTLWIEPQPADAPVPFQVTVLGPGDATVAGPVECAGRGVLRFASVAPAGEYNVVFKTEAATWRIRWEIQAAPA